MSDKFLPAILGKNIVAQRKMIGLSQKELAAKLGISYESLSRIERGLALPKSSRLQDIAEALQCSVSFLFQVSSPTIEERAKAIAVALDNISVEQQDGTIKAIFATIDAVKAGN